MAKSAVIGSLRVDLGMNSAAFTKGLRKAQSGLGDFSKVAKANFAVVAVAAASAASALSVAVLSAAKSTAELAAEARTAGVAFEEFQRLKYAAEQNQVSIEALTDGLKELNLRADEFVKTGGGSAKEAFERLGLSADELENRLKNPSQLFTEIIGRLSQLDVAAQIRISDEIFGGTGGEQFVRLLKGGARGLEDLKKQADDLGLVLSGNTARAAEQLNASVERGKSVMAGLSNKILHAVLPSFNDLAKTLSDPQFAQAAQNIAVAIVSAMDWAAKAVAGLNNALDKFRSTANKQSMTGLKHEMAAVVNSRIKLAEDIARMEAKLAGSTKNNLAVSTMAVQLRTAREEFDRLTNSASALQDRMKEIQSGQSQQMTFSPTDKPGKLTTDPITRVDLGSGGGATKSYADLVQGAQRFIEVQQLEAHALSLTSGAASKLRFEQDLMNQALNDNIALNPVQLEQIEGLASAMSDAQLKLEGAQLTLSNTAPWANMGTEIAGLNDMLRLGAIGWETYAGAVSKAVGASIGSVASMASEAAGLLGQMFEDSKEVAIAQAVLSAGEGIARTMGAYPFPYNIGMAGLHAAAAVAQIAKISSTSKSSTSLSGGAAVSGGASGAVVQGPEKRVFDLNLRGAESGVLTIEQFVETFKSALGDGYEVNVNQMAR